MTAQDHHTEISLVRQHLKRAATHEPAQAQPFINTLGKQLRVYAEGNDDDKAALRPEIEKNIRRLEVARADVA